MLELVDVLVGVACSDHTPPVTRQAALYGVKLLTRRLARKHHEHFIKVNLKITQKWYLTISDDCVRT